jgi:hypothetical protein
MSDLSTDAPVALNYDDMLASIMEDLESNEVNDPTPDRRLVERIGKGAVAWYIAYTTKA